MRTCAHIHNKNLSELHDKVHEMLAGRIAVCLGRRVVDRKKVLDGNLLLDPFVQPPLPH